ncbi:MAG: hypothetical protein ACYTHK_20285, partial [Planctomycetota bacterium]
MSATPAPSRVRGRGALADVVRSGSLLLELQDLGELAQRGDSLGRFGGLGFAGEQPLDVRDLLVRRAGVLVVAREL